MSKQRERLQYGRQLLQEREECDVQSLFPKRHETTFALMVKHRYCFGQGQRINAKFQFHYSIVAL